MASTYYHHGNWKQPKQLSVVNGEVLICRTIRLLKECGVEDIVITGNDERFVGLGVPWIRYDSSGHWLNAFMPTKEPTCYIFGDVYFSPAAIKTIVDKETTNINFFASTPPFSNDYPKHFAEPFAFKVANVEYFFECIERTKHYERIGTIRRAISWELWQVISGGELGKIDYSTITAINDYTSDLDFPEDVEELEEKLQNIENSKAMKYVIHACPKRLWYVKSHLVPSMQEQGCENISVDVDEEYKGSLYAYMNSFLQLPNDNSGTWHLQDDVLICKDFKHRTELYNGGVVCGFSSAMYDGSKPAGLVDIKDKWFSFPCIRIPNKIARNCAEWVTQYIIGNMVYETFWKLGRNEDWAFWQFMKDYCKGMKILNLAPNLVDHVDYLIGGSASAKNRENPCRSRFFEDVELVEKLERSL